MVAAALAAWVLSIGSGVEWIDPAITTGPARSPPVRLIVNTALLTSVWESDGVPVSVTLTRTSAWAVLGTADRSSEYGEGPADAEAMSHEAPLSVEYSTRRVETPL